MNLINNFDSWKKKLGFQWISTIYVAVISFVVSVLLARELGVENFGNYSYILSLAGIILIIQDGGYKMLIFRENVDHSSSRLLMSYAVSHTLLISMLCTLVIILLHPQRWFTILMAVWCMGLVAICGFVSSLLKGKGDFKSDAIWKIVTRSLTAGAILWALFFYNDKAITSLFIFWSSALLLALIWPIYKRYLKLPSFNFQNNLIKSSIVFLTIDVATILYFRSDIVLLEYFGNVEGDVGQYSAAYRIIEGLILLATPFALIAFHSLRQSYNMKENFFRLFWIFLLTIFFAAICIVGLGALWGEKFMVIVFGVDYASAGTLLLWLLFALLFIFPNYILTQGSIALNREVGYAKIVIVVAILNILLNIWLIPEFGAIGAAWATIFAEGVLFICLSKMIWHDWRRSKNENWS